MASIGISCILFISCLVLFATQATCWNRNATIGHHTFEFDTCKVNCSDYPFTTIYDVNGRGHLDSYTLVCVLLSTTNDYASVCNVDFVILDKFINYLSRSYNQSDDYISLDFTLNLDCSDNKQKMRVKLGNAHGIEHMNFISSLFIFDCGVGWSDIDVFGKAFDLDFVLAPSPRDDILYRNHTHLQKLGVLWLKGHSGVTGIPPVLFEFKWHEMGVLKLNNLALNSFQDFQISHAMPHLQELDLNYNMLTIPPDFPWDNQLLRIHGNLSRREAICAVVNACQVSNLPRNVYIRALRLEHNNITDLSSHSFKGCLHMLSLRGNGLKVINPKCFYDLWDIQRLDLAQNQLKAIPTELFVINQDKATLEYIDLSYNAITSLSPSQFQAQTNLIQIDLSHNELGIIRRGTFSHLKRLKVIALNNNLLKLIEEGSFLEDINSLRHINFSKNKLNRPPVFLFYWITLDTASLQMNMIDFDGLCKAFDHVNLPNLYVFPREKDKKVVINLSNNNISHFDLPKMTLLQRYKFTAILQYFELDLTDNPLYCDCKTFHLFIYLWKLLKRHRDRAHFYRTWRCINLNDSPILTRNPDDFQCFLKSQGCPKECICKHTHHHTIFVYCQDKNLTQVPASMPHETEYLHLNKNQISLIDGKRYLTRLRYLNMSDNYLSFISPKALHMLQGAIVDLTRNKLTALPPDIQTMKFSSLLIAHNVWRCDCQAIWMKHWLRSSSSFIADWDQIVCSSGGDPGVPIIYVEDERFVCDPLLKEGEIAGIVASCSLLLIIISLLLVYKFSTEIKIILYTRFNWHPFDRFNIDEDPGKTHDVFIAYCGDDSDWIYNVLIEELENVHDPPYKTLFHARDFDVGGPIAENIVRCIDQSKRMVMVLSESFIESDWCMFEFHTAHARVIAEHKNFIIIIMLDDITGLELDKTLQSYIRTHVYLSVDDKWFWKKLYYALPPIVVREEPEHPHVEVREEPEHPHVEVGDEPEQMRLRNNRYEML